MEIKEPRPTPPFAPISGFITSETGLLTEASWFTHWIIIRVKIYSCRANASWKCEVKKRRFRNLHVFTCLSSMAKLVFPIYLDQTQFVLTEKCSLTYYFPRQNLKTQTEQLLCFSGVTELYEWLHHFKQTNIHSRCNYGQGCLVSV